jgi:DNA end-binding protein Ku
LILQIFLPSDVYNKVMAYSFKSAIAFGLVYVPVTLQSCVKSKDIGFNMLYKKTGERIRYKKTCENCPANLTEDDIVRGYQYEKDRYVILTDKEIESVKSEKNKSIEITQFVKLGEIDPIFFDKSYYITPTGAEKAFKLITSAIESENKVGIAKTVLGTKEQLVALRAINGNLILFTLHFSDEIQAVPINKTDETLTEKELKLAKQIINKMSEKFEPKKFKDEYREKLTQAIESKIKGQKIHVTKPSVRTHNVISIIDALKKSLENASGPDAKSKKRA